MSVKSCGDNPGKEVKSFNDNCLVVNDKLGDEQLATKETSDSIH